MKKEIRKNSGQSPFLSQVAFTLSGGRRPLSGYRRAAFTLAEVLITLAVIGIVAALTIPNIIQDYKKMQTITRVKKAYAIVDQAIKMSIVDNGSTKSWMNSSATNYTTTLNFFNKYIKPYYKIEKICTGENSYITNDWENCGYTSPTITRANGGKNNDLFGQYGNRVIFQTADGMVYFIYPYETKYRETEDSTPDNPKYIYYAEMTGVFEVAVDINGAQGPNQWGKDTFLFSLNHDKGSMMPNGVELVNEKIDEGCSSSGFTCAAKLQKDNWVMKDDYPW